MVFLLTLIFLVFYFVRPQDFTGGAMQGERIVLYILGTTLSIWAVKMILNQKILIRNPKDIFVIGLFIAVIVSTLTVRWAAYTIDTVILFGKAALVYFLISDILNSPGKFKIFLWTIVVCVFIVGVLGILQYYGHDIMGIAPFVGVELKDGALIEVKRIRGVGLFDTNQLAYLMGFALPFAYALFKLTRNFILKICLLIFSFVYAVATYFTLSRGGILAFAAAIGFLYLLRKGATSKFFMVIAVGFLILFLTTTPTRLGTIGGFKSDSSSQGRLNAWYAGAQAWKESPVIGVGVNTYVDHFKIAAHNAVVQVIVETGVFGFFFWLGLMYFTFKALTRLMKKYAGTDQNWIFVFSFSLLATFFQLLVSCCFSNGAAYNFYTFIFFGVVTALEEYAMQQEAKAQAKEVTRGMLVQFNDIVKICVVMIIVIIVWKVVLTTALV
ncbi:MAG: O-antigen ligase family protein [Candidatus Omnitrophota bacterium]